MEKQNQQNNDNPDPNDALESEYIKTILDLILRVVEQEKAQKRQWSTNIMIAAAIAFLASLLAAGINLYSLFIK